MKTEKELKEGCGKYISLGLTHDYKCTRNDLCRVCKAKLETLQERNSEVKQAIEEWAETFNFDDKEKRKLLQKLGLGDEE